MPWKPLDDDIPLDHEALHPAEPAPTVAAAPDPAAGPSDSATVAPAAEGLTELPPNAKLDDEPPVQPPPVITRVGPAAAVNATPMETTEGFADTMEAPKTYHSALTPEQVKEYETFFRDPRKPPDPEALRKWIHEKTGTFMPADNAAEIVEHFKNTGEYSTSQKILLPTESKGAVGAGGQHFGNALLGDWGAEISAPFGALGLGSEDRPDVFNSDASFGQLTAQNADITRAQLDRNTAEHPVTSAIGEVGGIVAAAPVGGAVADVARVGELGEIGAAMTKGATGGGIYGSGAAGPGHRLEGAAVGATVAPVASVALKVPMAGYRAATSVLETAPRQARRIIAKAIEDDANTPANMGRDIAEAHANDVPMAPADTGENVRGLLAAASRKSGLGRTIARDALEARQDELADRVVGHIERDLGPIANPHEVADQLMTEASAKAGPLYHQAYSMPVADAFMQRITPLLKRPSMQKAFTNARRIAQEEGDDPDTLGLTVADGKAQLTGTPSWRTLDYIKRGMDDVVEDYRSDVTGKLVLDTEGKAVNNTLRSYLSEMDKANPVYAQARAAYAGPVRGVSAMNLGRKFVGMGADDIEARMRDMSPFEKDMAALGARRQMAEIIRAKGDTADVVNALVGSGKKRAMLSRLFGDRKQFQRFVDTLDQEKQGWRTYRQALQGSPTAANLQDDVALEAVQTGAEMMVHGGVPVATAVRKVSQMFGRQISEKVHQQIAALLSNTEPAALRELAAQLQRGAVRRARRATIGKSVRGSLGRSAVVLQAQEAQ